MYKFQVFYNREISVEQGQRMLQQMVDKFGAQGPSDLKIAIPGITIHENPFPQWLQDWFIWAGFYYEDFNHCYVQDNLTKARAQEIEQFIERNLRLPYAGREDVARVHTRIMSGDANTEMLEDF